MTKTKKFKASDLDKMPTLLRRYITKPGEEVYSFKFEVNCQVNIYHPPGKHLNSLKSAIEHAFKARKAFKD